MQIHAFPNSNHSLVHFQCFFSIKNSTNSLCPPSAAPRIPEFQSFASPFSMFFSIKNSTNSLCPPHAALIIPEFQSFAPLEIKKSTNSLCPPYAAPRIPPFQSFASPFSMPFFYKKTLLILYVLHMQL